MTGTGSSTSGTRPTGTAPGSSSSSSTGSASTGGGQGAPSSAALTKLLQSAGTTWSAATDGSQSAATLELSSDTAVMAIGGFSGSDPVPTLSQFQQYVANHQVTYYIAPDRDGGGHGGKQHSDIGDWVASTFTPKQVGSDTVYDLTAPAS